MRNLSNSNGVFIDKNNYIKCMMLVGLLVSCISIYSQNSNPAKTEQCKLVVGKGFKITNINGKKTTVNGGKEIALEPGEHKIIYEHSFIMTMGTSKLNVTDLNQEITFYFESGKKYKIDATESKQPGITTSGPTEITEIAK
jgi:hypothetical protein